MTAFTRPAAHPRFFTQNTGRRCQQPHGVVTMPATLGEGRGAQPLAGGVGCPPRILLGVEWAGYTRRFYLPLGGGFGPAPLALRPRIAFATLMPRSRQLHPRNRSTPTVIRGIGNHVAGAGFKPAFPSPLSMNGSTLPSCASLSSPYTPLMMSNPSSRFLATSLRMRGLSLLT